MSQLGELSIQRFGPSPQNLITVPQVQSESEYWTSAVQLGLENQKLWYFNGGPLFGYLMAFGFTMAYSIEQNSTHLVHNYWKRKQKGNYFVRISNGSVQEWLAP